MSVTVDSKIQKWGNGLGLRVSGALRDIPHFAENTYVKVEVFEEGFTVKKAEPEEKLLVFSEEELLQGLDSETAHSELLAQPLKSEWLDD